MFEHALVIGGTGMLKDTTVAIAGRSRRLTSVARTSTSLARIEQGIAGLSCIHHPLVLDWNDRGHFLSALAAHSQSVGSPTLIAAWLHDDTLGPAIARTLATGNRRCRFFQVRGSAAEDPTRIGDASPLGAEMPDSVDDHQIVLGFRIEGDTSRWLTHSEISKGVVAALDEPGKIHRVGSLLPWDRRP